MVGVRLQNPALALLCADLTSMKFRTWGNCEGWGEKTLFGGVCPDNAEAVDRTW